MFLPQFATGPYFCTPGTGAFAGREVAMAHLKACVAAGITIGGVNSEGMLGQNEYQVLHLLLPGSCLLHWIHTYFSSICLSVSQTVLQAPEGRLQPTWDVNAYLPCRFGYLAALSVPYDERLYCNGTVADGASL